jgi:3-deoxy-manno-octulosonate cytidylyltransferase (CMP-KDO synthetase)
MTRADHPCGTDRIAEVALNLDADIIVNLQGDEPLIDPDSLDSVILMLQNDPGGEHGHARHPDTVSGSISLAALRQSGLR